MNITKLYEKKAARTIKSFAVIGERCSHSKQAPYGIKKAENVNPDDVVVLALPGTHDKQNAVYACNAFLKKIVTHTFAENQPKGLRFCVAIENYGKYFSPQDAIFLLNRKIADPNSYQNMMQNFCADKREEYEMPQAIKDIFAAIYAPRLKSTGNLKLTKELIKQRLQKIIIVTYCHGFYWALRLEEFLSQSLLKIGFDKQEIIRLQQTMLVIAFVPNVDVLLSKSNVTAVVSASDLSSSWKSMMVKYTHRHFIVEHFGYCCETYKHKHIFYCDQFTTGKRVLIPIESWSDLSQTTNKTLGEHSFLGFNPTDEVSNSGAVIQKMVKNILLKTIDMRRKNRFDSPSSAWYYNQIKERWLYRKACLNAKFLHCKIWFWKRKPQKRSFTSELQTVTLD